MKENIMSDTNPTAGAPDPWTALVAVMATWEQNPDPEALRRALQAYNEHVDALLAKVQADGAPENKPTSAWEWAARQFDPAYQDRAGQ
jgi:hypothetical protein